MELGRCPKCHTPYRAADIAAHGVLRPRTQARGGPLMDYRCASCGRRIRLVPHGAGRYAPPGQPPPQPVPESQRRPHWVGPDGHASTREAPPPPPREAPAPEAEPPPHEIPDPEPSPVVAPANDIQRALDVLGVGPGASRAEIEAAFRQRSKTCHPDKVAHLDDDFQTLATEKFRALREAYELLVS